MRVQEAIVGVGAFAMEIRAIRTEADYDEALKEIQQYFEKVPEPGTPEADRFDVLAALIGAYERVHWSIEEATKAVTVAPRLC
jgi:HTH-type transcriptional regulator/antitoxin HigA